MGRVQPAAILENLVKLAVTELAKKTGVSDAASMAILLLTPANMRKATDIVAAIQTGARTTAEIARAAGCDDDADFRLFLAGMDQLGWFETEDDGRFHLIPELRVFRIELP